MRAIVQERYGGPERMRLAEVPEPTVADDTVLVRVRAVSLNAYDWHMLRGEPYLVRLGEGLRRPKIAIRGADLAGVVEAVGPAVTAFRPGDEVFGARSGALAELVAGRERNFEPMPAGASFEDAAAVPTVAVTALQAIRDKARIQAGERVLVNGATGGVGHFLVQIAKSVGADVTATCRPANVDFVRGLGADRVIDRTRDDVTRLGERYDAILDVVGEHSLRSMRRAMAPHGRLVIVGGSRGNWVGPLVRPVSEVVLSRVGRRRFLPFLAHHAKSDLIVLREMLADGRIRPHVDRTWPLADAADAMRFLETGHPQGKVVVRVPG